MTQILAFAKVALAGLTPYEQRFLEIYRDYKLQEAQYYGVTITSSTTLDDTENITDSTYSFNLTGRNVTQRSWLGSGYEYIFLYIVLMIVAYMGILIYNRRRVRPYEGREMDREPYGTDQYPSHPVIPPAGYTPAPQRFPYYSSGYTL